MEKTEDKSNTEHFDFFEKTQGDFAMQILQPFMSPRDYTNIFLLGKNLKNYRLSISWLEGAFRELIPSCDNQQRRYLKQLFLGFKGGLAAKLSTLQPEEANYYLIKINQVESILKTTKNAIKDPYGQYEFEYKQKPLFFTKQWLFEGISPISACVTFCQPFREPQVSYSWTGTGILRFKVNVDHFSEEAKKVLEDKNGTIQSGLFYYLRPECQLIHSKIIFECRGIGDNILSSDTAHLEADWPPKTNPYEEPLRYRQLMFKVNPLTLSEKPYSFIIDIELTTKNLAETGLSLESSGVFGMRISGVFLRMIPC